MNIRSSKKVKDYKGFISFHYAIHNNNQETAELLISHGANINEKDNDGNTTLHYTAINNCQEIAKLLISAGLNINEKNKYGKTALHFAAQKIIKKWLNSLYHMVQI